MQFEEKRRIDQTGRKNQIDVLQMLRDESPVDRRVEGEKALLVIDDGEWRRVRGSQIEKNQRHGRFRAERRQNLLVVRHGNENAVDQTRLIDRRAQSDERQFAMISQIIVQTIELISKKTNVRRKAFCFDLLSISSTSRR